VRRGVSSAIANALRQANELTPGVVLVDIMLGHQSGIDLARCWPKPSRAALPSS